MTAEQPVMPRWPTDDEVDANPEFWTAILMARGLFEPGPGGTGKDLAYWYESAESTVPPTPLMRQWLGYLWQQMRDTKPRGRAPDSHGAPRQREEQAKYDLARRVLERRRRWLAEPEQAGRQNVPLHKTRQFIVDEFNEGRYPRTRTWLNDGWSAA